MKWKCCSVEGRGNGCSHVWTMVMISLAVSVMLVASDEGGDAVAEEFAPLPQVSFPHHRLGGPNFRRPLSPQEQTEILTDLQQNHRFNQQPFNNQGPRQPNFQNFQQQLQPNLFNQQQNQQGFFNQQPNQQPRFQQQQPLTTQQTSNRFSGPLVTQQSPVLLSLQQSPLSSPQFSSLFTQQQQQQSPFSTQNSQILNQLPPEQISLQNSPLSNFQGILSQQPQETPQLPIPSLQPPLILPAQQQPQTPLTFQQPPLTTQQSSEIFSQQPVSPLSTQQSIPSTKESVENNPQLATQQTRSEVVKDIKVLSAVPNTEFTIEKSVSDPEELKKVQELELKREKDQRERLLKLQQEQIKQIKEHNERRLKERQEEEKRDEERRAKFLEDLKRIEEEKARRLKEQEEERLRLIEEEKARLLKQQQEEKLKKEREDRLRKIEEDKQKREELENNSGEEEQEEEQHLSTIPGVIYAQPTQETSRENYETLQSQAPQFSTLQPPYFGENSPQEDQNPQLPTQANKQFRSRQRARIVEETGVPDGLLLQQERQKLYYQIQQQQNQLSNDEKQQTEESQQVANNQKPINQIVPNKQNQRRNQQSKISELEKQLQQKQLQEQLQKQFQLQLLQRQDLLRQLKLAVTNAAIPTNEDQIAPGPIAISGGNSSAPLFLANGQKIQVVQSSRQGRPVDVVPRNRATATTATVTTTQRPPRALFEELTKGVLPPGADFEVIRHKQDGGLEGVGKQLPQNLPEKKVTFVFLEEQPDGSFKVKGVKGNNNEQAGNEQAPTADVDSIIKKIQDGDLKLPAPSKSSPVPPKSQPPTNLSSSSSSQQYVPKSTVNTFQTTPKPNNIIKTVSSNLNFQQNPEMEFFPSVTLPPFYNVDSTLSTSSAAINNPNKQKTTLSNSPYSVEVHSAGQNPIFSQTNTSPLVPLNTGSSNPYVSKTPESTIPPSQFNQNSQQINPVTPFPIVSQFSPTPNSVASNFAPNKYSPSPIPQYTTSAPKKQSRPKEPFLPTNPTFVNSSPQSYSPIIQQSPVPGVIYANPADAPQAKPASSYRDEGESPPLYGLQNQEYQQNEEAPSLKQPTRVAAPHHQNSLKENDKIAPLDEDGSVEYHTKVEAPLSLAQVLKKEGLYAMARFLRESGLNNILNDTGPYTVFAPTDKAFRALLVQLGGPEKAEEKFKENPRLLSGLLLHHVIPGAFELSTLQDEMTGVSLAGTQLRVNTYTTQDAEWNEVRVVTINGARISRDKHDIPIPQGVAHAVDRVMFPLPVGNVLQTLRADRERRFTKFLRAIQASGLTDTFSGNKVHTVFAPTDRAFSVVDAADLEGLLNDRDMARALVLRHSSPGTLYSAGMRFYQLRDSMEKGSAITLHKTNGQVKANNANVVTHNIPATNGVIHAIDGLL